MTNTSSFSFNPRVLIALAALGLSLNFMRISADHGIPFLMAWIIALVFSPLLLVIYRTAKPHLSFLGRDPDNPVHYSDMTRHPENQPLPGILILRLDAPIYYDNAQTVRDKIKKHIGEADLPPKAVILDSTSQDSLDVTSSEILISLPRELKADGIEVYVAEVHTPVLDFSQRTELYELIGDEHIFTTVNSAVMYAEQSI